jgi:hypothetical protein
MPQKLATLSAREKAVPRWSESAVEGGEMPAVDAVLCRKNVTVVGALANGLTAGDKVAIRANVEEILAFADGADRLMQGQRTYRPTYTVTRGSCDGVSHLNR